MRTTRTTTESSLIRAVGVALLGACLATPAAAQFEPTGGGSTGGRGGTTSGGGNTGGNTGGNSGAAVGTTSNGGNGGSGGSVPDYIASFNSSSLYKVDPSMSSLTRSWMNEALASMGSADKIAQIGKSEYVCEVAGPFGTMKLSVSRTFSGNLKFEQEVRPSTPGAPARVISYDFIASPPEFRAFDTSGDPLILEPSEEAIEVLRRTADLWNPVLAVLDQFGSVESVDAGTVGSTPCTVLTLGSPRLDGLTEGKLYLDAVTKRPVSVETTVTRDIAISGMYTITAWQTIAGIQVPLTLDVTGPDGKSTVTFTDIRLYDVFGNEL